MEKLGGIRNFLLMEIALLKLQGFQGALDA